jgi:phosphohistidine phosphatase SixA
MTKIHQLLFIALLATLGVSANANDSATASDQSPRFIYLLRHAEKLPGKNPDLTDAGLKRAVHYAEFFRHLPIDVIYSSHFKRTQQTAAPIAETLGLAIKTFDPFAQKAFAEQLMQLQGNALIVGHNNLTEIIEALGGTVDSAIEHSDFERVYQLVVIDKHVTATLRYTSYLQ